MALIHCPECGKEISDTAKRCIHCGASIKKAKQPFLLWLNNNILSNSKRKKRYAILHYICLGLALCFIVLLILTFATPKIFQPGKHEYSRAMKCLETYDLLFEDFSIWRDSPQTDGTGRTADVINIILKNDTHIEYTFFCDGDLKIAYRGDGECFLRYKDALKPITDGAEQIVFEVQDCLEISDSIITVFLEQESLSFSNILDDFYRFGSTIKTIRIVSIVVGILFFFAFILLTVIRRIALKRMCKQ